MEENEYYVKITVTQEGETKVEANIDKEDVKEFLLISLLGMERNDKRISEEQAETQEPNMEDKTQ